MHSLYFSPWPITCNRSEISQFYNHNYNEHSHLFHFKKITPAEDLSFKLFESLLMAENAESEDEVKRAPGAESDNAPVTDKTTAAAESVRSSVTISPKTLPCGRLEKFEDSSFFRRGDQRLQLPSPDEVRQKYRESSRFYETLWRPPPVRFPDLDLLVKFGGKITIAEDQCLWALQHSTLKDKLPTPEVYGWCQDNEETFLYMKLVRGDTLEQRWPDLSDTDRSACCEQLKPMIEALRYLKLDGNEQFIGKPTFLVIIVDERLN